MAGAWALLVGLAAVAPPGDAAAPPPTAARALEVHNGRGVSYFRGRVRCPFAGAGTRAADASNRVAIDDEYSRVAIDAVAGRIAIENAHRYDHKQVIVDLAFLAEGRTAAGALVPASVHVKIEKKGTRVEADVHPHWTVRDKLVSAVLEPFDIVISDGRDSALLVSRERLVRAATEQKIGYRLADSLIEIEDNRKGVAAATLAADTPLADLSLGVGSKLLHKMFLRAQLTSADDRNAALAGRPLPELLAQGAWELRLTALSSLLSQDTIRRDLFLLGLEGVPVVAAGMKRGLAKGETLAFAFQAGKGRVTWGRHSAQLDHALDIARAFLEFNFLGGVLAQKVAAAAPPTRRTQ
jgi:hypothetical protein